MNSKEAGGDVFSCPVNSIVCQGNPHTVSLDHKGVLFRFIQFLFYLSEQILTDNIDQTLSNCVSLSDPNYFTLLLFLCISGHFNSVECCPTATFSQITPLTNQFYLNVMIICDDRFTFFGGLGPYHMYTLIRVRDFSDLEDR